MSVSELFAVGEKTYKKANLENYDRFKGHWKGYYIGFMNLVNLPDGMEDLEVKRGGSFNMQFNFANYSINLNKRGNFGLQTGLGLEYQRLRFDNPGVTLAKIDGKVVPASTAFTPPSALKTAVTLSKPQFFKISALSVTHTLKSSAASTSLSAIEQSAPATNLKAV